MNEAWKPIKGYEGGYEVSSLGNVRSYKRRRPFLMSLVPNRDGYATVQLFDGRRNSTRFIVHRLVCRAFNGEPEPGQEAAHLDGSRTNNRADNLRWCSSKENNAHKRLHGTRQSGVRNGRSKLNEVQVVAIRGMARGGFTERKIAELAGVGKSQVHRILAGQQWND